MLLRVLSTIGMIVSVGMPAAAQRQQATPKESAKDSSKSAAIPTSARPPKGMCRVWIDGVPAAQQPAATDCPTAIKNRPANAHVIFGDESADTSKATTGKSALPPNVKGFTNVKPTPPVLPARPPQD